MDAPVTNQASRFRKWLFRFLGLAIVLLALYLWRAPVLGGLARLWIVNETPAKADAIVVLGGGLDTRPFEAARLYHKGLAPKILVLKVHPTRADELGVTMPETDSAVFILLKQEVPEKDIVVIGDGVNNTHDESLAVRHWAEEHKPKRLLIPTDLFHTRRVRWLFRKMLKETGVEVLVEAVPLKDYTAANWWQNEKGLIAFQTEVLKFAYYRVKY
jgi:uncharacterized SAM-binding protein YcdF (DUF218 family)